MASPTNKFMSEIFVIGHRNPDTDAICSAIGYAEFKRRTGMPEAVAARCGDTNDRIDFVLETFGVPSPRFVADVSPKVRDVMQAEILSVTAGRDRRRGARPDGRARHPRAAGAGRRAAMPRAALVVQAEQISFSGGEPAGGFAARAVVAGKSGQDARRKVVDRPRSADARRN